MTDNAAAGLHSITPYFTVDDADRLVAFLRAVFDGQVIMEDRNANNRIRHARVRIGDSVIMLNESGPDYEANRSQMHLYVRDVDAVFSTALAEGATSLMEPNQRPHGARMAGFRDPNDNIWWVATPE